MMTASAYGCEYIGDNNIEICEPHKNELYACADCLVDDVCGFHADTINRCADDD